MIDGIAPRSARGRFVVMDYSVLDHASRKLHLEQMKVILKTEAWAKSEIDMMVWISYENVEKIE